MRDSLGLIGLTFSELGFLLVVIVVLVSLSQADADDVVPEADYKKLQAALAQAETDLAQTQTDLAQTQAELDKAKREIKRLGDRLPPDTLPRTQTCEEAEIINRPVADVVILPAFNDDALQYYRINSGAPETVANFRERFAADIGRAEAAACLHAIRLGAEDEVSAATYRLALARLKQLFYVITD